MRHIAFYRFVPIADPASLAQHLRALTQGLAGAILVAREGVNGMLAGDAAALLAFQQALTADPRFDGLAFRASACGDRAPFQRMKVHVRPEIVPLGINGIDATGRPGTQLSPHAWRALIAQDDVVLIDNRNHFEVQLGRFRGAIDPQVRHFRDLPRYVLAHADEWRAQGRRLAMYCTGGIRCEKTAAWMEGDLGLPVFQLEGGILHYFSQMPDAERDWQGECFVFDNRIALDTRLQPTATTAEDVYAGDPQEAWRLQRAKRLAQGE